MRGFQIGPTAHPDDAFDIKYEDGETAHIPLRKVGLWEWLPGSRTMTIVTTEGERRVYSHASWSVTVYNPEGTN